MARQLTKIYQDNEGHLPDMRKIKIKKNSSGFKTFLSFFFWPVYYRRLGPDFFTPNNKKFSEDQINLAINGPQNVTAGTTTTYKISYENNQGQALTKVTLNAQYPKGFVFLSSDPVSNNSGHTEWSLDKIAPYKKERLLL